ncbi:MAG: AAA family ATPase [Gammaproteobacteria bacterium]|nr:AAA family ATPase [Gammaproteobacteria bacterium]
MPEYTNPFRPGAGHQPPYLAGRQSERQQVVRLLEQDAVFENALITGLRGVGKTVLLDALKPSVTEQNWIWIGTDLKESASISEDNIATRLCTDLSIVTSTIAVSAVRKRSIGFSADETKEATTLTYERLKGIYDRTAGLPLDKLKAVIESAWAALSKTGAHGIVFAYDEAQNLTDHAAKERFPLSLLLDTFQSIQRKGLPVLLVLAGLPTLFPKLVQARTFSERMFRSVFLGRLSREESREAILKPIEDTDSVRLSDESVDTVIDLSRGYPYFIQFICREVYDAFIRRLDKGERASVPVADIERKLDTDFFAGRWAKTTDRQRDLLSVIAQLESRDEEFTVQEIVEKARELSIRGFSSSHTNQMLSALGSQGLVFKNRHGKYLFAEPLLAGYIRRQHTIET